MNANDPVFRTQTVNSDGSKQECGLSKRELMAAMVLQGLCSRSGSDKYFIIGGKHLGYDKAAIALADALIAELSK